MKRVVAILTVSIYLALSVLQIVSIHFCHGKIQSFSLTTPTKSCCGDLTVEQRGCCTDVLIKVDFEPDQLISNSILLEHISFIDLFIPRLNDTEDSLSDSDNFNYYGPDKGPPPLELFLLNSSFLFYG